MSITASLAPPRSPALWRRLVARVLSAPRLLPWRGGDAPPCRHTSHDIGLDRQHQEYAPRGRRAHASVRQLHARAERLGAGLPE